MTWETYKETERSNLVESYAQFINLMGVTK